VSAAAGEKRLCMEQCGLGLLRLLRLPVLECQPDQILAETRDCVLRLPWKCSTALAASVVAGVKLEKRGACYWRKLGVL